MLFKRLADKRAFSLIEISVVLVIAGLLITATIKGVSLIFKAKTYNVQAQINNIKMAVEDFREKYSALPGDRENTNGKLEGNPYSAAAKAGKFWHQLCEEGKYSDCGVPSNSDHLYYGRGLPEASVGGGFTVHYNPEGLPSGHWLQLSEGNAGERSAGMGVLSPTEAYKIDKLLDNGLGNKGNVRGVTGKGSMKKCLLESGQYDTSHDENACVLFIRLL